MAEDEFASQKKQIPAGAGIASFNSADD